MHQYLRLGRDLAPGLREILSAHNWTGLPPELSKTGQYIRLPSGYAGVRDVPRHFFWMRDRLEPKENFLKALRLRNRTEKGVRGITWAGHGAGHGTSFSWFNYCVAKELMRAGVPLKAIWWDAKKVNSEFPVARYDADVECTISIINARWRPPNAVLRMCEWRSSAVLGYFQCEATLVPQNLRDLHRSFDAMLATARSTREAIMQSGYTGPVFVFGHGVDPAQFPLLDRPVGRTPYTFFHMADVQWRKGTDVLINVFRSLPHPDIRLYIKAQWRNREVPGYDQLCGKDPRIVWDFHCYPPDELAGLMAKMDCGVFPSRGEGFGLPKIEWEATGGPCIATDAFGYKDTSVPGGTILLSGKRIVAQIDAGEQVEPDPDHLRELMLWCLGNRERAAQRGRTAGANIHANWKWSDKIAELLEFLEQFGLKTGTRPLRVTA